MKLQYDKTADDLKKEKGDLENIPTLRYLRHQDSYKFNIGDVLIKQVSYGGYGTTPEEWRTERSSSTGAPTKFMYVFENELGVGYIKQLKIDGSGFTNTLHCVASLDPLCTRLSLDPEYVDHMLLGDGGDFQYNREYVDKKSFRQEAITRNKKLLVNVTSAKKRLEWVHQLKVGDTFWAAYRWDTVTTTEPYTITSIKDLPLTAVPTYVKNDLGSCFVFMPCYREIRTSHPNNFNSGLWQQDTFKFLRVSVTKLFSLKDELCGNQK
jgi:hypothetical protein